jgi:hypothetical protein
MVVKAAFEGAVDAFGVKDLQYLADIRSLAGLVAGVLPAQPERGLIRIALQQWLRPDPANSGLVAVSGSLPELLRTALAPLTPALDAAEDNHAHDADMSARTEEPTPETT